MSEEIIGVIKGVVRSKGVVGFQTYNLLITTKRIVAVIVGDTGLGLLLGGATVDLINKRQHYKKAMEMDIQTISPEILSSNKKNFEINNFDIDHIYLKNFFNSYQIHIKFVNKIKKIGKFILFEVHKKRREEVEPIILRAFPNKVVVK
jgi:hypothetical protein